MRNRNVAGGADCHSITSDLSVRPGSVVDGFVWSLTFCGRGSFRAGLATLLGALATSCFASGGVMGFAVGTSRSASSRPSGKVADSNHWEIAVLRSSIVAHPASRKPADMAVRTSATGRARKRVIILAVGPVSDSLGCPWGRA